MISKNYWFWIVSILSLIALSSAIVAEVVFKLEPCSMCLKQRYPYYFIIFLFFIFSVLKIKQRFWFYLGVEIASIYGLFYSIWHVGIEKKLLPGPEGCSIELKKAESISNLKDQILSKPVINCEDVVWSLFGLSAATINTFLIFLIFIINSIYILKSYASKKTNS